MGPLKVIEQAFKLELGKYMASILDEDWKQMRGMEAAGSNSAGAMQGFMGM